MTFETKYKIGIATNYWDDPRSLLRILNSTAYDICTVYYLIDGRYKGRADEPEYWDCGTQFAKEYKKVHYVKMEDALQIDKRNRYLELAEKDDLDFLIVCDSDHELYIEPIELEKELDILIDFDECRCFPISFNNLGTEMKTIKVFKKPFDYRHRQNTGPNISHSQLYNDYGKGKEELLGQYQRWQKGDTHKYVRGIRMIHNKEFRSKKRLDWDYVYYLNNPTR